MHAVLVSLLNRLVVAALFFVSGAFGAVFLWAALHRLGIHPYDGSIFDPGLWHWVMVAGFGCALTGFIGRDVMANRLLRSVRETYGVDVPDRRVTSIGERVLVVAIAFAATTAWYVWQR
jgi:hypothetical protein